MEHTQLKKEKKKETSLNGYSELPVRTAVVWDIVRGMVCVCVCVYIHLEEDVLIHMEEPGVSDQPYTCVMVEARVRLYG